MSRIAVINPNLSTGFTTKVGSQARNIVGASTEVLALNPRFGPDSIEGYYDEAFASVGLLSVIRELEAAPEQHTDPIGGYVVACFDDTGVDAARCMTTAPVLGLCEAAMRMAAAVSSRFAIVTPMAVSVRPLEHLVAKYGASSSVQLAFGPLISRVPMPKTHTQPLKSRQRFALRMIMPRRLFSDVRA
jgi:allantoin racemase